MATAKTHSKKEAASPFVPVEEQPYEVPENWCWTYVGNLCKFIGGGTPDKANSDYWNGNIYWASVKDIKDQYLFSTIDSITEYGLLNSATNLCEVDDLILVTRIEPAKTIIAKTVIAINQDLKIVKSSIPSLFLHYYFAAFKQEFEEKSSGSTVKGITIPNINKTFFPLPPLPEQQRIVDRIESLFAKLDEAKEKAQAVVDGFELRKSAILHKAFTGELTAQWREENGVGMESWIYKKLKNTSIQIIDGDRGINYPQKEDFFQEGYCIFLNAKNVTKDGFKFDSIQYITQEKDSILHNGRLERNDIVLTTRGTIGNIALYDSSISYEHLRINSGMVIYRGGAEFYKPFLIWLYKSSVVLNQIGKLRTGSAQPQLPIKVMNEIELPIPSYDEQKEIERCVSDMLIKEQQAKEVAEAVLDQIDTMKKAILARAFRGELGTNDPTEEWAGKLMQK